MSEPIFCRPRYDYGSYTDLYKLIHLSGYKLIYFDELDPTSDETYILTMVNGENQNGWLDAKARIILYDLEWRLEGDYPAMPGVCEVWAADKWYADKIGAKYVLLGSHPGLADSVHRNGEYTFDVTLMAYVYGRREAIKHGLESAGLKIGPNGWGSEREDIINHSRLMLHVHQLNMAATIAPQRFAMAAAFKIPLISESVTDPGLMTCEGIEYVPYGEIVPKVQERIGDSSLQKRGQALYQFLCEEHTFRKCIEAAL